MAELLANGGTVSLWADWSIVLPPAHCARNEDGSWSAWGADWTVDIHILEFGSPVGKTPDIPAPKQGKREFVEGRGWTGAVDRFAELDGEASVFRFAGTLVAPNTLMSCWVSCLREDQGAFAKNIISSISRSNVVA